MTVTHHIYVYVNSYLDERLRANIKRSCGTKKQDAHFSETKNKELVEFCRATELRRAERSAITNKNAILF